MRDKEQDILADVVEWSICKPIKEVNSEESWSLELLIRAHI